MAHVPLVRQAQSCIMQVDWINMIFTTVTISVTRMTTPLNSARTIGQSNFLVGYFYVVVICWWSLGQKSCVQLGKVHSRKVGLVWLRWASWRLGKGDPPQRSWRTPSRSHRQRSCPWKESFRFENCEWRMSTRNKKITLLWWKSYSAISKSYWSLKGEP